MSLKNPRDSFFANLKSDVFVVVVDIVDSVLDLMEEDVEADDTFDEAADSFG